NTTRQQATGHAPAAMPRLQSVSDGIFCGPTPNASDFQHLASSGVRTIVSVDGVRPDLENASAAGLRYVHLPVGYDEISPDRMLQLAHAVRTSSGATFVHCHHGFHRGPAAAAVAAILTGAMSPEEGIAVLRRCKTDPRYVGLWDSVRAATATRNPSSLDLPLPSYVPPSNLVRQMNQIDRSFDLVQHPRANLDRSALDQHQNPNQSDPPEDQQRLQQAMLLRQAFRELARTADSAEPHAIGTAAKSQSSTNQHLDANAEPQRVANTDEQGQSAGEWIAAIRDAETASQQLVLWLEQDADVLPPETKTTELQKRISRLRRSCVDCHRDHRN
ncbi:MAG: sulfur transferase domain-containing protein, partial [Planctomycetota bacterium]